MTTGTDALSRDLLSRGMLSLAANYNRELSPDVLMTYWHGLRDLNDAEFTAAVTMAIQGDQFWPTVARLRALARPEPDLTLEAAKVFAKVDGLKRYHPERGEQPNVREVRAVLGGAAAEAFIACGGGDAWLTRTPRDWPFVQKRFTEAYVLARRAEKQDEQRLALMRRASGDGEAAQIGPGGVL